ncbi:MAG: hypothetical protein ACKVQS_04470 [Fimbriimonadaceae bacterium]
MEPLFIDLGVTLEIHQVMIDVFGGAHGIRDECVLESALGAPKNAALYDGFEDD